MSAMPLVRKHDYPQALDLLRRAHELTPDNVRYAYVYAVALNSSGAAGEALALLKEANNKHPADRSVSTALVSIARDNGDFAAAAGTPASCSSSNPGTRSFRL